MLDFKCLFRNKIAEQWTKGNAGNGRRAMPAMNEVDYGKHGIPDVEKSPLE